MDDFLIGGLFAFIITTLLLPIIIKTASKYQIFTPKNHRRIHTGEISSLGGIAVFVAVVLSVLIFSDISRIYDSKYIFVGLTTLFLIGLQDDFFDIKPVYKLIAQISVALFLVIFENLYIEITIQEFYPIINYLISISVSTVFIVLVINAYNFMDGVDLLASLLAWLIMIPLGLWFYLNDQIYFGGLLFAFGSSLLSFMIYNFSPAKIFLGDMGTMVIGLILAISFIVFINLNYISPRSFGVNHPISTVFAIFSIPIMDLIRVSFYRLINGKLPWIADKCHIHHLFLKLGVKQNIAALIIVLVMILSFSLNQYLGKFLNSEFQLILINMSVIAVFLGSIQFLVFQKASQKTDK